MPDDSQGCVLVGMALQNGEMCHVLDSVKAYAHLRNVSGLLRASLRTVAARVRTAPTSDSKAARPRSRQRFALSAGA
ncbi:hypothetical protein [Ralstonia pseudosolanacearum]|uniref:hypothetical protein n=1 Tax=Ralstonia pseudosolanacearum TaxID=1310165 RepID=UPI00366FBE32